MSRSYRQRGRKRILVVSPPGVAFYGCDVLLSGKASTRMNQDQKVSEELWAGSLLKQFLKSPKLSRRFWGDSRPSSCSIIDHMEILSMTSSSPFPLSPPRSPPCGHTEISSLYLPSL